VALAAVLEMGAARAVEPNAAVRRTRANWPAKVHYYAASRTPPHIHFEGARGWTEERGLAMMGTPGAPAWFHFQPEDEHGPLKQLTFSHPTDGWWDNPGGRPGVNYHNARRAPEVWIKEGQLYTLPPQNIRHHPAGVGGPPRDLTVVLPPDYDPARRYPVLYLLDGQNLLDHRADGGPGWEVHQALGAAVQTGRARSVIIVGVHAGDRIAEYTPVPNEEVVDGRRVGGGGADRFLDTLRTEIIPFVDRHYATLADPAHRVIGGSSLGGLASAHALLSRPQDWAGAMLLSPSVWWPERGPHGERGILLDSVQRAGSLAHKRVFLYHGGQADGATTTGLLRDRFAQKGLARGRNLFYAQDPGGQHDEVAWRGVFQRALESMFPPEP
jgi:predicted alpha/beta superfamily hydrolase